MSRYSDTPPTIPKRSGVQKPNELLLPGERKPVLLSSFFFRLDMNEAQGLSLLFVYETGTRWSVEDWEGRSFALHR